MPNNKQTTAVQWLIEQLKSKYDIDIERLSVTDKAKAIERKQIEDAYNQDLYGGLEGNKKFNDGSDYFTSTFITD